MLYVEDSSDQRETPEHPTKQIKVRVFTFRRREWRCMLGLSSCKRNNRRLMLVKEQSDPKACKMLRKKMELEFEKQGQLGD